MAKSHGEGLLDPTVLAIVVSIGSLFSCDWPFLPQPWLVFFLHLYKPPGVIDSFELEVIFHTKTRPRYQGSLLLIDIWPFPPFHIQAWNTISQNSVWTALFSLGPIKLGLVLMALEWDFLHPCFFTAFVAFFYSIYPLEETSLVQRIQNQLIKFLQHILARIHNSFFAPCLLMSTHKVETSPFGQIQFPLRTNNLW